MIDLQDLRAAFPEPNEDVVTAAQGRIAAGYRMRVEQRTAAYIPTASVVSRGAGALRRAAGSRLRIVACVSVVATLGVGVVVFSPSHDAAALTETVAHVRVVTRSSAPMLATALSHVLTALNSTRIESLEVAADGDVTATVAGTDAPDTLRSLWYGGFAAAQVAIEGKLPPSASVLVQARSADGSTASETVGGHAAESSTDSASPTSANGLSTEIANAAASTGARVVSLAVLAVGGGAADIVLQPSSPAFLTDTASGLGEFVAHLEGHSYFVTVVDDSGRPQAAVGRLVNMGGSAGSGMEWVSPTVANSMTFGQPVTTSPLP